MFGIYSQFLFAIESFEQLEQGFKEWTKKAGLV